MPKTPKRRKSRRRNPVQKRSRETVNIILEATARVLVDHGYAHASTNKIAARAGVSIGTVYEYFPNKEAAIQALLEAIVKETIGQLQKPMTTMAGEPFEAVARKWLRMVVEMMQEHSKLLRVIVEQVPRWGTIDAVREVEQQMIGFTRSLAWHPGNQYPNENLEASMFLIAGMIRAAVLQIVLEKPDGLTTEKLIDELVNIIVGYYNYGQSRRVPS